jgi:uncharacterized protein
MKPVFADSVYFFALLNTRDRVHKSALRFTDQATNPVITTAGVPTEVADGLAGKTTRPAFVRLLEILESAPDVEVIPPSPDLFHRGLQRYVQRPDKDWCLTDCISFVVMEQRGLTEALTRDRHFEQAGFATLLK